MTTRNQRREGALNAIEPFLNEWLGHSPDHPSAFRNWAVEQLLWDHNLSTEQVEASVTDGTGDMGIDAWIKPDIESENGGVIQLFQSKYNTSHFNCLML